MGKDMLIFNCEYLRKDSTLKKTSYDKSNKSYMTDSDIHVCNFDNATRHFCKRTKSDCIPASCDALCTGVDGIAYLIEFKNGRVDSAELKIKTESSVETLVAMNAISESEASTNLEFILCYNGEKNVVPDSDSPLKFYRYGKALAKNEIRIAEIKSDMVRDYHTYDIMNFNSCFVKRLI